MEITSRHSLHILFEVFCKFFWVSSTVTYCKNSIRIFFREFLLSTVLGIPFRVSLGIMLKTFQEIPAEFFASETFSDDPAKLKSLKISSRFFPEVLS